jgi:Protein of unknown function (DUF2442)
MQTDFAERGMSISPSEFRPAMAQQVTVTDDALIVDLIDGRTVSVPVSWYPRLASIAIPPARPYSCCITLTSLPSGSRT